jgi:hypothetical protein
VSNAERKVQNAECGVMNKSAYQNDFGFIENSVGG